MPCLAVRDMTLLKTFRKGKMAHRRVGLSIGEDVNFIWLASRRCPLSEDAICPIILYLIPDGGYTMGALMPVGSGPDKEIVTLLNNLFSGINFETLSDHDTSKEKLFGNNRRLNRVAFRIGAYPAKDYQPDDAKRKWFYFLYHLPKAT